jgi:hypothetical protein
VILKLILHVARLPSLMRAATETMKTFSDNLISENVADGIEKINEFG